jgi:hypothetical protein
VPVLNPDKSVRDDMKEILDVVAKNNMTLASGHLHVSETWIIFEEAKKRGVTRLIFTHPEDIVDASLNDVKGLQAWALMSNIRYACFLKDVSLNHAKRTI